MIPDDHDLVDKATALDKEFGDRAIPRPSIGVVIGSRHCESSFGRVGHHDCTTDSGTVGIVFKTTNGSWSDWHLRYFCVATSRFAGAFLVSIGFQLGWRAKAAVEEKASVVGDGKVV